MSETEPGTPVPNVFRVDRVTQDALRKAAVDARVQFGPRNRGRLTFRASELGNVVNAVDADGKVAGCARKVFYSFWSEKFPGSPVDADAALNFARGDLEEAHAAKLLTQAGLLAEKHVNLGAWDPNARDARWRADPRYPDRSGGRIRGDVDFVINHPEVGRIPLDWKSSSSYAFRPLFMVGAKPDNSLQVAWYAYEMQTSHYAVGYVNKEDGQLAILLYETPTEWVERVLFPACDKLKARILAGEVPPRPEGTGPAPSLYEGSWPCFVFAPKKKRVMACPFYASCYGAAPPAAPKTIVASKPRAKKARGDPTKPSKNDLSFE